MPHIIVEYSKNLESKIKIQNLVNDLHHSLAEQGIDKARIKSRAISCDAVSVGNNEKNGHMLHATLLLLEGRDTKTKKKYGDALHQIMKNYIDNSINECSLTLEIRDMDNDTYYL